MSISTCSPSLNCSLSHDNNELLATINGTEFSVTDLPVDYDVAINILNKFDGNKTIADVGSEHEDVSIDVIHDIINSFQQSGLLVKNIEPEFITGTECILELEDLQNKLMYETLYKNVFWVACQTPESVPLNVYYGMGIENYHFLFRESWFDSPILSFPNSIDARTLMNEFFCEEYGHDELILKSLEKIGITREQIYKTAPLPETLSLCNALAHWAATDPIFFFSTMGVLEGKDLKLDSYVSAMEDSTTVPADFIEHIKAHSNINLQDEHGNLSRELFKRIPVVSKADLERMKRQTYLFIEIYDRFYTAIWNHYSTTNNLLREVC